MMVVNKDGFETNRRGVLWTETAMEINIPSITLLSRKRSGGEKSQPNNRVQGQGAFYFSSGARVRAVLCLHVELSLICWSAEACCGGGVWFLSCQKKAHMPHGGCSQWQIQTAVTCRSFCPLYMCSSSSRRWRGGKVNTGGFDPGRLRDGGQTSLKRIHPHEKVDFLNAYYVVMPSFTLFTSLNAVNFLKWNVFTRSNHV